MNIAIIVAFRNFRDEEYFIPKEILDKAGIKTVVFSSALGTALGSQGGEVEVADTIDNLKVSDYDAIVFVGGEGAKGLGDNPEAHRIGQESVEANKVLGAICIAPIILAKAGVLFGKKATVWSSPMDKAAVKILREEGAIYEDEPVAVDGRIITANGPLAAQRFAEKIIEALTRL